MKKDVQERVKRTLKQTIEFINQSIKGQKDRIYRSEEEFKSEVLDKLNEICEANGVKNYFSMSEGDKYLIIKCLGC